MIEERHTFLPYLEAFRFVLVGHDDELALWRAVTGFLRGRRELRRLDLGGVSVGVGVGIVEGEEVGGVEGVEG